MKKIYVIPSIDTVEFSPATDILAASSGQEDISSLLFNGERELIDRVTWGEGGLQ